MTPAQHKLIDRAASRYAVRFAPPPHPYDTLNEQQALAQVVIELAEEVYALKFPGDNRPLFEDGGPDPIGVSLEPLATAATGTNLFGTGINATATSPALTNDGKLDISATPESNEERYRRAWGNHPNDPMRPVTPRGESLVEAMRRQTREAAAECRKRLDELPAQPKHMTTQAIERELLDLARSGAMWDERQGRLSLLCNELRARMTGEPSNEHRTPPTDFRSTPARTRVRDELADILFPYMARATAGIMVDRILDQLMERSPSDQSWCYLQDVKNGAL